MSVKRKKWLILSLILGIALVTGFFFLKKQEEVHYHAGFQVYIDDELQDFSDLKYMHIVPCVSDGHEEIEEDEQIEKAHLHDGVGDVVHVHRNGAVWGDLFTNIAFPIDQEALVYVNGIIVEDFLNYPIKPYESLVILSGKSTELDEKLKLYEKLKNTVTREHIEEVEAKSESC